MNNIVSQTQQLIEKHKQDISNIGCYFPKIHRKSEFYEDTKDFKIWLGTIIRVKGLQGLWYDVPIIEYQIFVDLTDIKIHQFYQHFNIKAYKTMNLFIPNTDNAVLSKFQISEQERILKEHNNYQI